MIDQLPNEYKWLKREQAPRILIEALSLFGTLETPGEKDNPIILSWAKELGDPDVERDYRHDSIAWCGLFMAVCAKRARLEVPDKPLWALNWAKFGNPAPFPAKLGDVLVFKRTGGGHVGIYVGEDDTAYHVLGGNQKDSVSITRIAKSRLHALRRTAWKIAQPESVRRVFLSSNGQLSENEA